MYKVLCTWTVEEFIQIQQGKNMTQLKLKAQNIWISTS